MNQDELETELARILKEEIWKEITAESGITQQDLNNQIIDEIRKLEANLPK